MKAYFNCRAVALVKSLTDERDRWLLWLPVFLGTGIGFYFALTFEPVAWAAPATLAAAAMVIFLCRNNSTVLLISICIAVGALGFTVAEWRTFDARHIILDHQIGPTTVTGQIQRAEIFPDGTRLTLERVRIATLGADKTPELVRIRLRGKPTNFFAGDWVQMRAKIGPPPPPVMPNAYDFQRALYFSGIGATGFAFGSAEPLRQASGAADTDIGLGQWWQRSRQKLSGRIRSAIGGDAGAVASALITGDRSAIDAKTMAAFRNSGLAHLLAISGLHIGLVAGLLFFGVRAILALVPGFALTFPIKKWAALFAICGAFTYALIAGATVPTQRAFVMVGLVLTAVILDRQGISMRLVAGAAFII
ncbi:MAG: ComEC/Rec2 family competence protein, partial [Rhodospirillales bacterium]|nr:ComEC/Rec2 family competence protein [Rhodospirillales bacterium]